MAVNLIHDVSPRELKRRLEAHTSRNTLALPDRAKTFSAVAHFQKFDGFAKVVTKAEMDEHVANGCRELNRGLSATQSLSANHYAKQLLFGDLYPATHVNYGHGIYFAEPSCVTLDNPLFPRFSKIAEFYASKTGIGGVIMRGAIKQKAVTMSYDDLYDFYRQDRARAQKAGIADLGTYAVAIGIDAFYVEERFGYAPEEMIWNVVNRTMLVLQNVGLRYASESGEFGLTDHKM